MQSYQAQVIFPPKLGEENQWGTVNCLMEVPKEYLGATWAPKYERFEFNLRLPPEAPESRYLATKKRGDTVKIGWDETRGKGNNAFVLLDIPQHNVMDDETDNAAPVRGHPPPPPPQHIQGGNSMKMDLQEWASALKTMATVLAGCTKSIMDEFDLSDDIAARIAITCSIGLDRRVTVDLSTPPPKPQVFKGHEDVEKSVNAAATAVANSRVKTIAQFFGAIVTHDPTGYYANDEQQAKAHVGELLRSGGYSSADVSFTDTTSMFNLAIVAYKIAGDILKHGDVAEAVKDNAKKEGDEWTLF